MSLCVRILLSAPYTATQHGNQDVETFLIVISECLNESNGS